MGIASMPKRASASSASLASSQARAGFSGAMQDNPAFQHDERFSTSHIRDWDGVSAPRSFNDAARRRWKSLLLAGFLFFFGSSMILMGATRILGYVPSMQEGQATGMLVLGALAFLPGGYHMWIAWQAFQGKHGYSLDQIPLVE